MFRTIRLELFLPFRPFKKTASIRKTTISAQILHESKTKWRVAKRKTGAAAKQTADCAALQSQMTTEPWNHGTIEPKISNGSRMWSAAGRCPAAMKTREQTETTNERK